MIVLTSDKSVGTLQEFLDLPETKPAQEFANGAILQKPMPKGRHSRLQAKLCSVINNLAEDSKIAYALTDGHIFKNASEYVH